MILSNYVRFSSRFFKYNPGCLSLQYMYYHVNFFLSDNIQGCRKVVENCETDATGSVQQTPCWKIQKPLSDTNLDITLSQDDLKTLNTINKYR